jgi:hypothetical protein
VTIYVFDTGPLLCCASYTQGPAILQAHCAGTRSVMLMDVVGEFRKLERKGDRVQKAAARAPRAYPWIDRVEITDPELLLKVERVREMIDTHRIPPKGAKRHEREDWVDAASIVWADEEGDAIFVVHDNFASKTARRMGVETKTLMDILRDECAAGVMTPQAAFKFYEHLGTDFDAGEAIWGPSDFR